MSTLAVSSPATADRAPDALAPPPGNPRFPLFDGLRAIAALSIVVTHVSGITRFNEINSLGALTARMNAGVALFFVISGFLLYRPFVAARVHGRPRPRIRDYARRRLLRIVPGYWVALTVLAATVGLPGVFSHDWWAYYGFLQIYSGNWILGGIGPAWSLCVEMSFYVVLPVFALAMARLCRGRSLRTAVRLEVAVLAGLSVASLALRVHAHQQVAGGVLNNTLPTHLTWFAAGMGLALASVLAEARPGQHRLARAVSRRGWVAWALAGVAFLAVSSAPLGLPRGFPPVYDSFQWAAEHVLYVTVGALLALPAVFGDPRDGVIRRLLGLPLMAWLGLVSYGIFLYHAPLMIHGWERGAMDVLPTFPFVSALLVTTLSALLCAALSYYVVERPFLRRKDGRRRRRRPPAATAAATDAERVPASVG